VGETEASLVKLRQGLKIEYLAGARFDSCRWSFDDTDELFLGKENETELSRSLPWSKALFSAVELLFVMWQYARKCLLLCSLLAHAVRWMSNPQSIFGFVHLAEKDAAVLAFINLIQ
jgi:hypothetical protein